MSIDQNCRQVFIDYFFAVYDRVARGFTNFNGIAACFFKAIFGLLFWAARQFIYDLYGTFNSDCGQFRTVVTAPFWALNDRVGRLQGLFCDSAVSAIYN